MKIYQAVGVSHGFVLGHAKWLRKGNLGGTRHRAHHDLDLKELVDRTKRMLAQMEQQTASTLGEEESSIFAVHQMILEDDYLMDDIRQRLANGMALKESVLGGIQALAKQFQELDDEYMKERSADFSNLGQLMSSIIDGDLEDVRFSPGTVLVTEELYPTDILYMQQKEVVAVVAATGGVNGHAAILARSLGLPAVFGIGEGAADIREGSAVIVDGMDGTVYIEPDEETLRWYEVQKNEYEVRIARIAAFKGEKARLRDGTPMMITANAGKISDCAQLDTHALDGIGLYRTEYLYHDRDELPTEAEQFNHFKEVLRIAGERTVTFRTFDIGGDKPVPQLTVGLEANPFMGLRGIRLAFHHSSVFRTHLRALLRASVYGKMEIMFPFISNLDEVIRAKRMVAAVMEELDKEGVPFRRDIPLGIMVEMPSAAIQIDNLIGHCDFVSIGTNDLVQYTLGVDRTNALVADLYREEDPAILQLIAKVAASGIQHRVPVSVCGEMAGNSRFTKFLVGIGVTKLSMSPSRTAEVKAVLSKVDQETCKTFAKEVLLQPSAEKVRQLLLQS